MSKSTLTFILKFSLIATPCAALAEPAQEFRCSTDSLTPAKALQRLEWARKCGLLQNSAGPNNWFPSAAALDLTFQPAKEYRELNTNQAFSGSLHNYNVNFYYANGRYQGSLKATGIRPKFLDKLEDKGIKVPSSLFAPEGWDRQ